MMKETFKLQMISKPFQENGENYLVLAGSSQILTLNTISYYIWQNCNGKTISQLSQDIYNTIINKEDVTLEQINIDCTSTVDKLIKNTLISFIDE